MLFDSRLTTYNSSPSFDNTLPSGRSPVRISLTSPESTLIADTVPDVLLLTYAHFAPGPNVTICDVLPFVSKCFTTERFTGSTISSLSGASVVTASNPVLGSTSIPCGR